MKIIGYQVDHVTSCGLLEGLLAYHDNLQEREVARKENITDF